MIEALVELLMQNFDMYLGALPKYIRAVVWWETVGIGVLSFTVLAMLMARTAWKQRLDVMKLHYNMLIVNEVLNFSIEEHCISLLPIAPRYSPVKNAALREALLDNLLLLTGLERRFLAQKYVELGFAASNLRDCDSYFWWKRLKASSELSYLCLPQFAPRIYDLLKDKNHYVAIAARIGLSATPHPLNTPLLLKNLPPELIERGNVLVEIAKNLGEIQGVDKLTDFLGPIHPDVVRESCLAAIIALKSEGTANIVLDLLRGDDPLTPQMISRALVYIRKLDDSSHKPVVSRYLRHPDSRVRVEAAHWYLLFMVDPSTGGFNTLGFDLDAQIEALAAQELYGDAA